MKTTAAKGKSPEHPFSFGLAASARNLIVQERHTFAHMGIQKHDSCQLTERADYMLSGRWFDADLRDTTCHTPVEE